MAKLKVLVVYPGRFGFHVVSYFLCKYGAQAHDFTYLGLSFGTAERSEGSVGLPNVSVHDHQCKHGLFGRRAVLRLIKEEVIAGGHDVIFTAYIPGISLLRRFFQKNKIKVIVDIRSGFLIKSTLKRVLLNRLLRYECRRYDHISINSQLLAKYLGFREEETTELPLGAEPVSFASRNFNKLRLLYVGSLTKRNVELTVMGLKQYIDRFGKDEVEKYDIVGAGRPHEEQAIRAAIHSSGLDEIVELHGYVPREKLPAFLRSANVGVSFVPITPYYDMQPVTKTYEFLLAGLPLIATRTTQNQRLINDKNGVLVDDTADSFAQGIAEFKSKSTSFDPENIQAASLNHAWRNVIPEKYIPYIESRASL